jgi:sialic acid synthase SpsE
VIVSTGMATEAEIDETVEALRQEGARFMLMNCTSAYPPRYDQLHLGYMRVLRNRYGVLVGHSDHTPEATSAIAAAALGAVAIEKHFTLDRATGGPDKHVSLEPAEFRAMVDAIRNVEQALGDEKRVTEDEAVVRAWAHHSVVAVRDVAEGATLAAEDVAVKRPGSGIPAKHVEEVVGRVAARPIAADTPLQWADLR